MFLSDVVGLDCPDKNITIGEEVLNNMHLEKNAYLAGYVFSKDCCGIDPITTLSDDVVFWNFLRGYFDNVGNIYLSTFETPQCSLSVISDWLFDLIVSKCKIPYRVSNNCFYFNNNNCLDFLGKLYDSSVVHSENKRSRYVELCTWNPILKDPDKSSRDYPLEHDTTFKWTKTRPDAVCPKKERVSDSGFDLVILEKVKQIGQVELWDTGIKVFPSYGWYFDLVPRSSIIKTGYMLANSVGIIDRTYTGNVLVALTKIDKDAPDMTSGSRVVQIIPRQIVHVQFDYIDETQLDKTSRGSGGFGSSGK